MWEWQCVSSRAPQLDVRWGVFAASKRVLQAVNRAIKITGSVYELLIVSGSEFGSEKDKDTESLCE